MKKILKISITLAMLTEITLIRGSVDFAVWINQLMGSLWA